MEWYVVGLGLLLLLMLFISIGLPIPFALAAASLPFLLGIQSLSISLITAELKLWGAWVDYILLAVPLFVLLGELIGRSSIGPNLYWFMHSKVPVRGSAAYGSIGACAGFGAVCGSSMVGSLTIGGIALPEMLKLGYGKRLSSGVLAAGGTLSVLLPPSLILLFYGIVTDQSIGELFCGFCVDACPKQALIMSREHEMSFVTRAEAVVLSGRNGPTLPACPPADTTAVPCTTTWRTLPPIS